MASIEEFRAVWTGFSGAPGYSIMYFASGAVNKPAKVKAFFDAIAGNISNDVTISYEATGKVIDDLTGNLVGTWTDTAAAATVGTSAGSYSILSGAYVRWLTAGAVNNRIVKGRTFIVPVSSASYDTDGTLIGTFVTALQTAANGMVGDPQTPLRIWSRPLKNAAGTITRNGSSHAVTDAVAPDRVTVLRSRRD